jgi:hypothetical protein
MSVWELGTPKDGTMKTLLRTTEEGFDLGGTEYELKEGKITVELPKKSAMILKACAKEESVVETDAESAAMAPVSMEKTDKNK